MMKGGQLRVTVLTPTIGGVSIGYAALNDTVPIRDQASFEAALRTEAFSGSGMLNFYVLYAAKGRLPAGTQCRLILRDAETDDVIQTIGTFAAIRDTMVEINIPLDYSNRSVRLAVKVENITKSLAFRLERWVVDAEDTFSSLPSKTALMKNEADGLLPSSYGLEQNYPNPFNPTTQFNFALPEPATVSLVVYDVLGRRVAELADGHHEAGYHSTIWNATDQASGVYFARFVVTSSSGEVKYSKVNKLVLMK